ncbi:glutaredoxin [candidate division TA06 bacterium DG_78]|uniref:Glutaredoxin n=1 Tax=candidate division TA06 bacterium DG_78 TaxID=1703772 RepID=A0A0S7YDC1_UNCT6|nr:MAG: glutaredoxin [candidate division TA06 bacterium DG_78]
MDIKHVEGKNRGNIILYALSTCVWCKKTKRLLNDLGVDYSYIDVDLLQGEEQEKIRQEVTRWNPSCSFPTLVINSEKCIVGYKENEIKEVLG